MIVADENIDGSLVEQLRKKGFEVEYIRELSPGMDDRDIIKFVKGKSAILLTEDKDFGELVFAYNFKNLSVIFLRHEKDDFPIVKKRLLSVLNSYCNKSGHFFIIITRSKVRITEF